MRFHSVTQNRAPGFQLAPMVDVVFLLLCFFVATQIFSQWETEIDIKLPSAETGKIPGRLPGEIIINIMENGTAIVNGKALEQASLVILLGRIVEIFPGQPVVIRADKGTDYEHVIRILDLCRQSDIWNISFATAVEDKKDE